MWFGIGNPENSHNFQYLSQAASHNIRYPLYHVLGDGRYVIPINSKLKLSEYMMLNKFCILTSAYETSECLNNFNPL